VVLTVSVVMRVFPRTHASIRNTYIDWTSVKRLDGEYSSIYLGAVGDLASKYGDLYIVGARERFGNL
jgi:hypothetical protein